jgi:hypothetical protein
MNEQYNKAYCCKTNGNQCHPQHYFNPSFQEQKKAGHLIIHRKTKSDNQGGYK